MLSKKQSEDFTLRYAEWLEKYLKGQLACDIKGVYAAGALAGYTRSQIKAARAWHGKSIDSDMLGSTTLWRWCF